MGLRQEVDHLIAIHAIHSMSKGLLESPAYYQALPLRPMLLYILFNSDWFCFETYPFFPQIYRELCHPHVPQS